MIPQMPVVPLPRFVSVPAGSLLMGSHDGQDDERPVHRVWVDGFEIGEHPVTRIEYAGFLESTDRVAPRDWSSPTFSDPSQPVVGVDWHDAVAYCGWLMEHLRRQSDTDLAICRLPTEAEWEHAARGGRDGESYPWGTAIPAWVPNGGRGPLPAPWPVTLGEPNAFGLYGIAGNIHEWCADWHSREYYTGSPASNPTGPTEGLRRASRGGAWRHALTMSRSAARSKLDPSFRYTDYGFRVVRAAARMSTARSLLSTVRGL